MNAPPLGANYSFTFGGVNFSVDIDDSLFSDYRTKKYPENIKNALHFHSLYEIFFVFDSSMTITYEYGTTEYKNCIVCLPPKTKHFAHRSSDYRMLFSCSAKEPTNDDFADFFTKNLTSRGVLCIADITPGIKACLEEVCTFFYTQKNKITTECMIAALKLIFYHIFTCVAPPKKTNDLHTQSNYIMIDSIISRCTAPGFDVSLRGIANALHLSEKQTSRLIYKYYGKPLSKLIAEGRLDYAAFLLTYTDKPISDIITESNFNSANYFYSLFKQRYGCTPLNYRKDKMNV
jgi:AraC-like DNA-binding protein